MRKLAEMKTIGTILTLQLCHRVKRLIL